MALFSKQEIFCHACGRKYKTDFNFRYMEGTCSEECLRELEWKRTLATTGSEYYPRDKSEVKSEAL